jgi:hypothetical protein
MRLPRHVAAQFRHVALRHRGPCARGLGSAATPTPRFVGARECDSARPSARLRGRSNHSTILRRIVARRWNPKRALATAARF